MYTAKDRRRYREEKQVKVKRKNKKVLKIVLEFTKCWFKVDENSKFSFENIEVRKSEKTTAKYSSILLVTHKMARDNVKLLFRPLQI